MRRRPFLAALLGGAASLSGLARPRPARAQLELDITRGVIEPLPIAISELDGDDAARAAEGARDRRRRQRRSRALGPVPPDRPARLHPVAGRAAQPAALRRLAADQRPGTGHRRGDRRRPGRRAGGRVPPLGRVRRHPDARPALRHLDRATGAASRTRSPTRSTSGSPARRAISTPGSSTSAETGAERRPHQAHRDHGPGRRQPPLPDRRRRPRSDAALPPGRPARSPTCATAA